MLESMRRRQFLPVLLAPLAGCAGLPAREAERTPAHAIARDSFAAVHDGAGFALLGAAIAVSEQHLLTSGHVVRSVDVVELHRGDGAASVAGRVVARSGRLDLAVLEAPAGAFRAAPIAEPPRSGDPVWAVGPGQSGRSIAPGRVRRESAQLRRYGPGFTAQMAAMMGHSGGPVADRTGRLAGLTTAMLGGGRARVLSLLVGMDLDGLIAGEGREVFVLAIGPALEEAAALIG